MSAKVMTIGIPRAMLYYRFHILWENFFKELGVELVISPPTDKQILEEGRTFAIDETCLCTKIFLGHVHFLIGKCDYVLIPRISNYGRNRYMCTKFEALYDMSRNVFRDSGQKFLSYNVDERRNNDEETALTDMCVSMGLGKRETYKAYKKAKKAEAEYLKDNVKKQELLIQEGTVKILLAGHSYVIRDPYIGTPVMEMLKRMDVTVIPADVIESKEALKRSAKVSPTLKWEISREIVGCIDKNRDMVDGIILMSAFPCGPDSMVNEMIIRKYQGIPVLNMVIDGQNGLAGVETRLESFIDIINFKGGRL